MKKSVKIGLAVLAVVVVIIIIAVATSSSEPPSPPFETTFTDVTGVTNANGLNRALTLATPLVPGKYSNFYVSYNGLDQNWGGAGLVATIGIRDRTTQAVKTSWATGWSVADRKGGSGTVFSNTVVIPDKVTVTANDEAFVNFDGMYAGYSANVRSGTIKLFNS